MEYRNSRLKLNQLSIHSNLLKERSVAIGITFEQIMQADFVLFIRDCMDSIRDKSYQNWWPHSLLYIAGRERTFEIFARAESIQYFESIRAIFDIQKKEDFSVLFTAFNDGKLRVPTWEFRSTNPSSLLGFDALSTRP
jgi:hypothetical protein